jgi:hypothetical protein
MTSIGQLILDEIIRQGMVRSHECSSVCFVWSANTAEQLEALVEEYYTGRKFTAPQVETIAHNIIAQLKHADELSQLSHRALIEKVLNTDAADYDVVIELMNRVLPGWEK